MLFVFSSSLPSSSPPLPSQVPQNLGSHTSRHGEADEAIPSLAPFDAITPSHHPTQVKGNCGFNHPHGEHRSEGEGVEVQVEGEGEGEPEEGDEKEKDEALGGGVGVELFHDAGLSVAGGEARSQACLFIVCVEREAINK